MHRCAACLKCTHASWKAIYIMVLESLLFMKRVFSAVYLRGRRTASEIVTAASAYVGGLNAAFQFICGVLLLQMLGVCCRSTKNSSDTTEPYPMNELEQLKAEEVEGLVQLREQMKALQMQVNSMRRAKAESTQSEVEPETPVWMDAPAVCTC